MNKKYLLLGIVVLTLSQALVAQKWVRNPANGRYYALSKKGKWGQAQAEAKLWNGNLATVRNQAENAWLVQTFSPTKTNKLWIGYSDVVVEKTWVWISGEPTTYTNWCAGQPDNAAGGGGQDEAEIADKSGCWNDNNSNVVQFGIMEIPSPKWIKNPANGRFYALSQAATWSGAQAEAKSLGANLATVRNKSEGDWLAKTFSVSLTTQNQPWIGLTDAAKEGVWVWASGEKFTYSNWAANQPDNARGAEDCVHLYNSAGQWNDHGCNVVRTGIMEMAVIRSPVNGHLYAATAVMTWKQAEAQAVKWGGHLATIRNRTEHDWIYNQFKNRVPNAGDAYWIGYTDEAKEGTWVWTSGENLSPKFEHWFTGEPNNALGKEHYAHVFGPKGNPDGEAASFWNDGSNIPLRRPQGGFIGIVEVRPASFSTFGKGCASTTSLPTISSATSPRLGQRFTLAIKGFLPKQQFGRLILGVSSTKWGLIPLPLPLGIIGANNCNLHVSLNSSLLIATTTQGSFNATFTVPTSTSLLGTIVYGQAWMPDPKANPVGIATTDAFKAVIG